MKLLVSLLPSMPEVTSDTDVAVVIDVLRATTVMTVALDGGAEKIITCPSVDQARELAKDHNALLCGERDCVRIEGFDLGNSPAEYQPDVVAGRTLVLTTTNGTRAIAACASAKRVVTASFLNFEAILQQLESHSRIHIVCAGTNGAVTLEDSLLAGALVNALELQNENLQLVGDEPRFARQLWRSWFGKDVGIDANMLEKCFAESQGGRNLIAKGYEADLSRCAGKHQKDAVPNRTTTTPATFSADR